MSNFSLIKPEHIKYWNSERLYIRSIDNFWAKTHLAALNLFFQILMNLVGGGEIYHSAFSFHMTGYEGDIFTSTNMFKFKYKYAKKFEVQNGSVPRYFYTMEVSKHQYLSQEHRQCDSEPKETLRKCLERYFNQRMKCRLPWFKPRTSPGLSECTEVSHTRKYLELIANMSELTKEKFMEEISCTSPCTMHEYQFEEAMASKIPCSNGALCMENSPLHMFAVQDANLYVSREVPLYDINSFIADVGGYLGLLLGASVISLYEWFMEMLQALSSKFAGHNKWWTGNIIANIYPSRLNWIEL